MARFKADENVPDRVVRLLRERGHDVRTVLQQRMVGAPDPDVAAAADAERRCVLTLDLDFADIRHVVPGEGPGVVVLRAGTQSAPEVMTVALALVAALETRDVARDLWVVDRTRIRIRDAEGRTAPG